MNGANVDLMAVQGAAEASALALAFAVLQGQLALIFLIAGTSKVLGLSGILAFFDHMRVPQGARVLTGCIEMVVGAGLFYGFHEPSIAVMSALIACPALLGGVISNTTRERGGGAWLATGFMLVLCVLIAYVRSR